MQSVAMHGRLTFKLENSYYTVGASEKQSNTISVA